MSTEDLGPTAGPSAMWIGPIELHAMRTFVGNGYPSGRFSLANVPFRHGSEDYRTAAFVTHHIKQEEIDAGQAKLLADIETRTQAELDFAISLMGISNEGLSSLEIIRKHEYTINTLISTKSAEVADYTREANKFYGSSPLNKNPKDFIKRFYEIQSPLSGQEGARAFDMWQASYEAAHAATIVNKSISILNRKLTTLSRERTLVTAQIGRQEIEASGRYFMLQQQEAASVARQLAQQQTEAAAQQIAQQQANAAAQKIKETEATKPAQEQVKRQQLTADAQTTLASTFAAPSSAFVTQGAAGVLEKAINVGKQAFIRSASKALARNPAVLAMLYSPDVADGERPSPVFGTPLPQLNLSGSLDLGYVASVKGSIDVPHRMVVEGIGENSTPKWVVADGVKVGTKVRVRSLTYNAQNDTYDFTRDGDTIPSLVWTPIARPGDSSTSSPATPPVLPADPGTPIAPVAPELETYPEVAGNDPDDYILKGPDGSGLPDTYVLFKDPRTVPGIATGYGKPVTGTWLGDATRSEGAPIPSHIADQLRGENFSSFDKQREAIWKAVAKDRELSRQFSQSNLDRMRDGTAPYPRKEDKAGGRDKFEIHHKHEVAKGGEVYDMDNIVIMTPKQHIAHHGKIANEL